MKTLKNGLIAIGLSLTLLISSVGFTSTAVADEVSPNAEITLEAQQPVSSSDKSAQDPLVEERGARTWVLKHALKGIAGMIRSGGSQFVNLGAKFDGICGLPKTD
ncbi:hypothetical protein [Gleimia hominis]|uniref:hypothetical protein n=1 Tax=Gleimia hominis TaxID=595468 RepID=UPI0011AF3E0E|nr:hypothetical protein [Gleimia hominis]WIK65064.1 hypothetical protein CJ187_003165 [Gleimia hominis]